MASLVSSAALEVRDFAVQRSGTAFRARVPALELDPGAAAALLGPSGCGKTSVLLALLGLDAGLAVSGEVTLMGAPLPPTGSAAWRRLLFERVALVLQDARAALDPLLPLGAQLRAATASSEQDIAGALRDLGIEAPAAVAARYPHQVSGGQAQRVCLAVALLRRPHLVVADEPTAALDDLRLDDLVRSLQLLRERTGTAVLIATHDHALLAALGAQAWVHEAGVFQRARAARPAWPAVERARDDRDGAIALRCSGVGVRRGTSWILRDVSLELPRARTVALVGPSGAGKTTLAKVLAGHVRPTTGTVEAMGGRGSVQMLFQDAFASLTPGRAIRDLVAEVARADFDVDAEAARLGLEPAQLARPAAALSGGERRRAALLRALAVRPAVLVLDEPTASLDRATAIPVIATLLEAQRRAGLALLLITHDLELARAVADRVERIEAGRLCG